MQGRQIIVKTAPVEYLSEHALLLLILAPHPPKYPALPSDAGAVPYPDPPARARRPRSLFLAQALPHRICVRNLPRSTTQEKLR